jgi:pimeloyl-ACP methyl ester carboxylesterase
MFGENFFYILYFQEDRAQHEFESDVRRAMRLFTWGAAGERDALPADSGFGSAMANKKATSTLFEGLNVEGMPPWTSEEDLDYYVEQFEKGGFLGPLNRYRCMDIDHEQLPELQDKKIEQPALFIAGDKDPVATFAPMDPMKMFVPNLKMVMVPGVGHWTQQEAPEAVNKAMIEFLDLL